MNEAVKPDDVEAPLRRPTPVPKRRGAAAGAALSSGSLVVAVLAGAGVFAWQKFEHAAPSANGEESAGRPAPPPQTVRVAPVALGDMPITIDALGTVTPFETVTIRTQIAGEAAGASASPRARRSRRATSSPRSIRAPMRPRSPRRRGNWPRTRRCSTQAQGDLARYQTLAKQDSIAKQQVTDQMALVAQDKAAIAADQAQVKTAELNLGYTHIVSPITGRVGLRLVDPGNYLQPSDATGIVVITEIDPISVVFSTPEDNLPRIAARLNSGAKLPVTVLDRANVNPLATGTLTTYDSQIDVTTGTIKMRATFDNPDGALFPNQFVNVRLLVDTMTGATLAPNAAIQIGASGDFVYLLNEDSTVSKRDVTVGPTDGKHTVIASGLTAGDKVVIDGVDRLRDGAKVNVVDSPPANGAQGSGEGHDQAGPAAGPASGEGQHRRRRHDQSGAAETPPAPAPAPAAGAAPGSAAGGAAKQGAPQ